MALMAINIWWTGSYVIQCENAGVSHFRYGLNLASLCIRFCSPDVYVSIFRSVYIAL